MQRNAVRLLRIYPVFLGIFVVQMGMAQTPKTNTVIEKDPPMAADATPSFLVAAIRPSDPDAAGGWSFESEGHHIKCVRATVMDILAVAYGVQTRQIVGEPAWLSKDRYDVSGVPDVPGVPNVTQLRGMYQKLLAERFHMVLHREMREMPVYALTVAKGGPHLKVAGPDETMNAGNSGDGSQRTLRFTNMSMKDLADNLDFYEDRPVIDQTDLPGRYDFTLKWAYDISAESGPGAPPSLFTAIKEQLGLRLDAVKGPAEVVVIDHVERPSEN
ncbi:TIGR03435 family protein [Granulicella sp. 5B5]|uniref:TIGR03435 family protein n=1 Tax=Granulicella sp. 5B5 TaxID=1617967 RepID=UPI0015F44FEA|nr:TIGR03435 family protein [Granulicella sp. 5B5]QMV19956.1 TIGR03435 family protein [Granulicella sp. 5B5]